MPKIQARKTRELLHKSGREHLEQHISDVIWPAELAGWCSEFGDEFEFKYVDTASSVEQYRIIFRQLRDEA